MDRATVGKIGQLLGLLVGVALLVATSTDAGQVGFGGFGNFGNIAIGGFVGGALFGGFGNDGGSVTTAVPQASSLLLTVVGLSVAVWGAWRNRR